MRQRKKYRAHYKKNSDGTHQSLCGLDEVAQVKKLFEKYGISLNRIAELLHMPPVTFYRKIKRETSKDKNSETSFTLDELKDLRSLVEELIYDARLVLDIYMTLYPESIKAYNLQERLKDEIWERKQQKEEPFLKGSIVSLAD